MDTTTNPTPPRGKRRLPKTTKARLYAYVMPATSRRLADYCKPRGLSITALLSVIIPLGMDALEAAVKKPAPPPPN